MKAVCKKILEDKEDVAFNPIGLKFEKKFLVRYRVECSGEVDVAYSDRVMIGDGECPVIKGFKEISSSGMFMKETVLMFVYKVGKEKIVEYC